MKPVVSGDSPPPQHDAAHDPYGDVDAVHVPYVEVETVVGPLLLHRDDEVMTRNLIRWGVWEAAETRFLGHELRAGQTFVDVGANIGYFTILGARHTAPAGRVIAVEPEDRNVALLRANLGRNGCAHVEVVEAAAFSRTARMRLDVREANRGDHRLAPSSQHGPLVRCVALDDVLPDVVDAIKIDTQGFDHEVIAGLERTIAGNPDVLVLTELSHELESRGVAPAAVLDGYERMGFGLATLDWSGNTHRMSAQDVLSHRDSVGADINLVLRR